MKKLPVTGKGLDNWELELCHSASVTTPRLGQSARLSAWARRRTLYCLNRVFHPGELNQVAPTEEGFHQSKATPSERGYLGMTKTVCG